MKYILILSIAMLGISCSQPKINKQKNGLKKGTSNVSVRKSDAKKTTIATSDKNIYPDWVDTLISSYIKHTNNALVKSALNDKLNEEWVFDQVERTDTATYWVFNVGHDMRDTDNTDPRYISDSWVYIDSLKRNLYEYDLLNEKLVEWEKVKD